MKRTVYIGLMILIFSCSRKGAGLVKSISIYRSERSLSLTEGERAPLTALEAKFLKYYDANEDFSCLCTFEKFDQAKVMEIPTYAGTTTTYKSYGKVTCPVRNDKIQLTVYQLASSASIYADKLFLPFKDQTNGTETYGGGRYLDLSLRDVKEGNLPVDFNKAYNPLCAYKSGYRCPIPPPENHLNMKIEAGEKVYLGEGE